MVHGDTMAEKSLDPSDMRRGFRTRTPTGVLAVALLLFPMACVAPPFPGFRLQDPPDHFLYDANSGQAALIFPEREVMGQGAWWRMTPNDEHASIAITRFRGPVTLEDVEAARGRYAGRVAQMGGGRVSQLQFLRIDDREAWGWEEHHLLGEELSALAYRTVVLYDTMAVALEFYADMDEWMDPTLQKEVLLSYGFGQARILWGWVITLLLLGGVAVGGFLRSVTKSAGKTLANTEYDLPSIPKDDPTEGGADPEATGGADPGAAREPGEEEPHPDIPAPS